MSCPPGQLCINNTYISIFVVMAVISAYSLYNLQINKLNNGANNRQIHDYNNEILKRNLNIKIDMPEQAYRIEPGPIPDRDHSNKFYKRITNPLYAPEKTPPPVISTPDLYRMSVPGLPINIKTRGYGGDYQQIGIIYNEDTRLPLYGCPTYRGSNQWNYYTSTDSNQSIKLPINKLNAKCMDERGCPEISNGELINVSTYEGKNFKTELYSTDSARYIPFV